MRNLVVASIVAFASLFASAHMAANAAADRDARMVQHQEMAQATPAEIWYIRIAVTLDGATRNLQLMVPTDDGEPALLTFDSKAQCDETWAKDQDVSAALARFTKLVTSEGGGAVVMCVQWEHPAVKPKGEEI